MNLLRFAGISILLAGPMLYARQGCADSLQNAFSARISTEHDSNPAMSPTYPGSVQRVLFEPSYSLVSRDRENDLKAGLGLQLVRTSNTTLDANRDSPVVFLDWLHQYTHGEFRISPKYAETATRVSGVDSTGQVAAGSTRASRSLSGMLSNHLSELSTLAADGTFEKVTYKGGNYVDYSSESGGLKFSHALSEITTPFFRVSGTRYAPANGDPSSNLADAALGLDWKTEYSDWTLQGGAAKVGGGFKRILEGSVTGRFTGRRKEWTLNVGRQVVPSGLGGFVRADQALGSWRYALSEYNNTGIDLEARKNFPITINIDKTRSTTAGVWMEHDFTPLWKMRMYYRRWINQVNGNESVSSNLLGLSLAYESATLKPLTYEPNHD